MSKELKLTKETVFLFGSVHFSFKVLGTMKECKMVVGHLQ